MTRLLWERLAPYRWNLAIILALLLVQAITNLSLPTINGDIITNGVATGDVHYIERMGGFMLLLSAVLVVATIMAVYFGSKTAMAFGRDVRALLFRKVEDFSLAELNHFGTASLITRNTNDVYQVQQVVLMLLTVVLAAPFMAIGGIIMALRLNVPLSGVILVAIVVMGVFLAVLVTRALPLFRSMQAKIDRVNQVTREVLSGVRVIRAFDRTRYEEKRFDDANVDLTDTALRVNRMFAMTFPVIMLIMQLTTVVLILFGGKQIEYHGMAIGDLQAFLQYTYLILFSVIMATIMFVMVPRAAAAGERIQAVLDHGALGGPPRAAGHGRADGRPHRVSRRRVPLPGRRGTRAFAHLLHGAARADDRHRGQHRQRQVDPHQPHPAPLRRHRGHGARRRRRCARVRPAGAVAAYRPRPADGVPVQRQRRRQPALRAPRRE